MYGGGDAPADDAGRVWRVADRDPITDPRYETFEEFFAGLGMSPDEIKTVQENAASSADG